MPVDSPSLISAEFLRLPRDEQNLVIDSLLRDGSLVPHLADNMAQFAYRPEHPRYQELWLGLSALKLFEQRIDRILLRPHVRVFAALADAYRREIDSQPLDEDAETPEQLWAALGLAPELIDDLSGRWAALAELIVRQAGSHDWQRALGCVQAFRRMAGLIDDNMMRRLVAIPAAIVLSSRPNRRAIDIWRDVWARTSYHASDLFYHDSRLRRAILDQNVAHAYRLTSVLAKAGKKPSDLVGAVIRAGYDIDYADETPTLGFWVGASGLLEATPVLSPELFRSGLAKLVWDLAHEPRRRHERIFYDEISLIKSREILVDFRRATLRSDFMQSWGFAEYAFVHGVEPLELFDELVHLSPSFHNGGPRMLWAWEHLAAVETLLKLLPEDFGIYVMAHTVRLMARNPKNAELLDPFPDEEQ